MFKRKKAAPQPQERVTTGGIFSFRREDGSFVFEFEIQTHATGVTTHVRTQSRDAREAALCVDIMERLSKSGLSAVAHLRKLPPADPFKATVALIPITETK